MESHTAIAKSGTHRGNFGGVPSPKDVQAHDADRDSFLSAVGTLLPPEARRDPAEGNHAKPSSEPGAVQYRDKQPVAPGKSDGTRHPEEVADSCATPTCKNPNGSLGPGNLDRAAGDRKGQETHGAAGMSDAMEDDPLSANGKRAAEPGETPVVRKLARERAPENGRRAPSAVPTGETGNPVNTPAPYSEDESVNLRYSPSADSQSRPFHPEALTHPGYRDTEGKASNRSPAAINVKHRIRTPKDPAHQAAEPPRVGSPRPSGQGELPTATWNGPPAPEDRDLTDDRPRSSGSGALPSGVVEADRSLGEPEVSTGDILTGKGGHGQSPERRLFSPRLMERITERMMVLNRGERVEMRIDLKPEVLGGIRLHMESEDHQMTIRIVAELPMVKELIEHQLHQLRLDLQERGIDVGSLDVRTQQEAGQADIGRHPRPSTGNRDRHGVRHDRDDSGAPVQTWHSPSGAATLIDYFV